jgi:hypothetical protein
MAQIVGIPMASHVFKNQRLCWQLPNTLFLEYPLPPIFEPLPVAEGYAPPYSCRSGLRWIEFRNDHRIL